MKSNTAFNAYSILRSVLSSYFLNWYLICAWLCSPYTVSALNISLLSWKKFRKISPWLSTFFLLDDTQYIIRKNGILRQFHNRLSFVEISVLFLSRFWKSSPDIFLSFTASLRTFIMLSSVNPSAFKRDKYSEDNSYTSFLPVMISRRFLAYRKYWLSAS